MRLESIEAQKKSFVDSIQPLWSVRTTDNSYNKFQIRPHDPVKRFIGRKLVKILHPFINFCAKRRYPINIPFPYDFLCGERWSYDISINKLLSHFSKQDLRKNILVAGCGRAGEDVQFWLRRGFNNIQVIDIDHDLRWETEYIPAFKKKFKQNINFKQATLEELPFDDGIFDLTFSSAVLEHIRNPAKAIKEINRVTRTGGYSWHRFGPLYFCFSGDHCIDVYGLEHGYDHILKDEHEYRLMIGDKKFFSEHSADPLCYGWAALNQFSYYTPEEYLGLFEKYFKIEHLLIIISTEGMAFRSKYPLRWEELLKNTGLNEADLLIRSIIVILKKDK